MIAFSRIFEGSKDLEMKIDIHPGAQNHPGVLTLAPFRVARFSGDFS